MTRGRAIKRSGPRQDRLAEERTGSCPEWTFPRWRSRLAPLTVAAHTGQGRTAAGWSVASRLAVAIASDTMHPRRGGAASQSQQPRVA